TARAEENFILPQPPVVPTERFVSLIVLTHFWGPFPQGVGSGMLLDSPAGDKLFCSAAHAFKDDQTFKIKVGAVKETNPPGLFRLYWNLRVTTFDHSRHRLFVDRLNDLACFRLS